MPKLKNPVANKEAMKAEAAQAREEAGAKPFMISVTRILSELNSLKGDKSNVGALLAEAFKWDAVQAMGKARSDKAWDELENTGIIKTEGLAAGQTHILAESPMFMAQALVTQPVKRFSADAMADAMVKKFKCSRADALMMIEDAKKPTAPTKRLSIIER